MANWNSDNPSHVDTWFSLFRLKQTRKPFDAAGSLKMSDLLFFNPTSSEDYLKIEATLIANKIDQQFTIGGAKLESNISKNVAILDMITTLLDMDKTILDLAEVNDKNYCFINENK